MSEQEAAPELDLTACDREPIHRPGTIQPHGLLLALSGPDLTVAQASANLGDEIGSDVAEALGRRLADVLPALPSRLTGALRGLPADGRPQFLETLSLNAASSPRSFDAVAHRSGEFVILELEAVPPDVVASFEALYPTLRGFVEQLHAADTTEALCSLAAAGIRQITGFDRVLVYSFDAAWHGTVVAEARNGELPACLGLRFPASDIPAQARELYRRNRLRIIPDARYAPVPIVPVAEEPLDLSHSVLRSVSPVHVQYMLNMGTMASMSVSILRDGELWGLISCHSKAPRRVPLHVRDACDFLTQIFSLQLAARERGAEAEERVRLGFIQGQLLGYMTSQESFVDALLGHPGEFLELTGARGAAIVMGEECRCVGRTPDPDDVRAIAAWLSARHPEDVFATDSLAASHPEASRYAERASGLLAISISKLHASHVLWFRPEVVVTVSWGGDPRKPVVEQEGTPSLHPRRSFEVWKETVRARSAPWRSTEVEAARALRNSIVGIVLRRAEEMASLNDELRRSNEELEAFSYSVSHDLRAPFRHIVGYSELLKRHEGDRLTDEGRRYVETIIGSAYTAGTLVDNLLNFSQMGRTALKPRRVDMNALVAEVRQQLSREAAGRRVEWKIGCLDEADVDPIMFRLVIENLLSNAVKYTRHKDPAVIEIDCRREPGETIYFVRDNGVGFDMRYSGKLFGVFQRLHRVEEFEGTGIGLANVRRIVERHGGRAWGEGAVGRGATFYFSLPEGS
jgi:light-regulated signal transduction histidine kinase (bacteriophytochrome)